MGNVYRYGECDHCGKLIDDPQDFTFIVHGHKALTELQKMEDEKMAVGKIAAHFCGHCGGYVPLDNNECVCGHFMYQGWNYEDKNDKRRWKEPWNEEKERQSGPTVTLCLA